MKTFRFRIYFISSRNEIVINETTSPYIFHILIALRNVNAIETIAKQAILYDMDTKSIILKKNSDQLVSPSSMSKIMTIYYAFKKISEDLSLDDEFIVSRKAWKKGG